MSLSFPQSTKVELLRLVNVDEKYEVPSDTKHSFYLRTYQFTVSELAQVFSYREHSKKKWDEVAAWQQVRPRMAKY